MPDTKHIDVPASVPAAVSGENCTAESKVPFGARMASLDGIRGLAILAVIAYHTLRVYGDVGGLLKVWRALQESTWAGVDLFFVLSGFLITGILLDSREGPGYFRNFYARRALRIMPLYYAFLTVLLLLVPALLGPSRLPPMFSQLKANQLWAWTYLQNYLQAKGPHQLPGLGHFWSLAVEEQFYWFWPVVVYFLSRRRLLQLCLCVCLLEPVLRLMLLHAGFTGWAVRSLTFTRIDTLLYGAIAALLLRERSLLPARRYWVPILMTIAAAVLAVIGFRSGFIPYETSETVLAAYSAFGILFAVFVYSCAIGTRGVAPAMSTPLFQWFGRYSYAIYIFHPFVLGAYLIAISPRMAFLPSFASAILCFLFVTGMSAALGWVSWIVLESRCLKLKRYFEYGKQPPDRMPAAAPANATTS
jgi:peptidoglycan/LPS O-acetylase OafA/YrhL